MEDDIWSNNGLASPYYSEISPKQARAENPAIRLLLRILAEANIQEPDFSAIKKILEEGADGRYKNEIS